VGWGVLVGTAVSAKVIVAVGVLLGGGVAVADSRSTVTTSASGACGVGLLVTVQAVRMAVAKTTTTTIHFMLTNLCFIHSLHMALVNAAF
jgi:hypothetical protein